MKNENVAEDELGLVELDDEEVSDAFRSDKLCFPCIILEGIKTAEELQFLANHAFDVNCALPMFIKHCGVTKRAGSIDMTLVAMQGLGAIAAYKVTLCKTPTDQVTLDLADPGTLIKFIRI